MEFFTITDTPKKGPKEYWNEFGSDFGFTKEFPKSIKVLSEENAKKELKRATQWANGGRNLSIEPHNSALTKAARAT